MVTLDLYKAVSRQKINANKSSIFFSNNTSPELKAEILEVMGPMQDSKNNKYLRLPSIIRNSKKEVFVEEKEKVEKKLSGWKEKRLSMGGREILIKAVAQNIPTYTMSCFLLPNGLYDEIEGSLQI